MTRHSHSPNIMVLEVPSLILDGFDLLFSPNIMVFEVPSWIPADLEAL